VVTGTAWLNQMLSPLIPRSLQNRLLLTYLALMFLGVGGLIVWTGLRLQDASIQAAEHHLELQASLVATSLHEPLEDWRRGRDQGGRSLQALVQSSARTLGGRLTVYDSGLRTVISSEYDDEYFEDREYPDEDDDDHDDDDDDHDDDDDEDHPELVAARDGLEQYDQRWDESFGERALFAAAPLLSESGEVEGVVQLSTSLGPIFRDIIQTWAALVAAGAVVLLVTTVASLLLARQLAAPIRAVTVAADAIASGDLTHQIGPSGPEETRQLAQTFNRMAAQVRDMLARQEAFVADAAHELRSPLTSIRLRVEMIQQHGEEDPKIADRYMPKLLHDIDNMRRLIEHLLALSRLDQAEDSSRSPVDLAPLLYELTDDMGSLFQAAGLTLRVDVPPHLPETIADADAMRTVFRNLLDNALQYTPADGHVTLGAQSRDGNLEISVFDTGQGISPEHLPHIFERFYRIDKARSRRKGGAGLGLSLVRSIVESHGGRVDVESELAAGTSFTVQLPGPDPAPAWT
jgi:signal transduction histidine kinase